MIPLAEVNEISEKFGVASDTIEKDYVICWILFCLSKSGLKDDFVFYGGTAIKRVYFEEHRFSEDIDLISHKVFSTDSILGKLSCLYLAKEQANLTLTVDTDRIISRNNRVQLLVKYTGYDEIIGAPKEIRLDFSMDMQPFGKIVIQNVIESYSDLKEKSISLNVMSLNTILANKLGLLLDRTRNEPRDLFDVWFLLQHLHSFDYDLSEVRKAYYDKYGHQLSAQTLLRNITNIAKQGNWNQRLDEQIHDLPNIAKVIYEISERFKEIFPSEFD